MSSTVEGSRPCSASGLAPVAYVERSGRIESVHWGVAAVADSSGEVVLAAGDVGTATFLRSAAKPFQLLAMLDAGLDRAGALEDADLAIAAASHGGEPGHVERVRAFLARVGLNESALRCGPLAPLDEHARDDLIRAGAAPAPIHNNCSGKHAAMLATCRASGWPEESYLEPDHPLQQAILATVTRFAGTAPGIGVDGCGVPTFFLPVSAAARALAALVEEASRGGNAGRIVGAMCGNPWFTSGTSRLAYRLMSEVPGVLAKEGAEGFFVLGLPAGRTELGRTLGVALKVIDGAGEGARGREPAVAGALAQVARLSDAERERVDRLTLVDSRNAAGRLVGCVRSVLTLHRAGLPSVTRG